MGKYEASGNETLGSDHIYHWTAYKCDFYGKTINRNEPMSPPNYTSGKYHWIRTYMITNRELNIVFYDVSCRDEYKELYAEDLKTITEKF